MIYEFKCRATGNLVMTPAIAERLLDIIGKASGPKGIVTVDSMSEAIAALESAVARDKALASDPGSKASDDKAQGSGADRDEDLARQVSLSQRAFPLIEMLKRALTAQKDITWGI